ncbi:MAG TPA: AAA family ATPase [Chloroflexi bacterium]|jgi:replicative DNA helicase|nr:AAA family ATPase [Chloroflexota bacterium]
MVNTDPASLVGHLRREHPVTLARVIADVERQIAAGEVAHFVPMATGFYPLDDLLNGGMRPGELMIVGGPFGVGKTIFALQTARNVVMNDPQARALYVCYEHDVTHLMSRLLCLESAEHLPGQDALTLRRVYDMLYDSGNGGSAGGFIERLRHSARYGRVVQAIESYADRLVLVRASGDVSGLKQIRDWAKDVADAGASRMLLVVDYLQKIPANDSTVQTEDEITTLLAQGLKELAVSMQIQVLALAVSDRTGLKAQRMRLADLRGASALQYEADIGLVLNNKYEIVSREHLVYNRTQADTMRNWVVMSIEKNRAGINSVDIEFALDAAHFRMVPDGDFVRERLVDER